MAKPIRTTITASVPVYVREYVEGLAEQYDQTFSQIITAALALFHMAHVQAGDKEANEALNIGQALGAIGLFKQFPKGPKGAGNATQKGD